MLRASLLSLLLLICLVGCGINSVTRKELEAVKVGDVLVYRYKKPNGKSWMYADKVVRIEGDTYHYVTTAKESNTKNSSALNEFVEKKEFSIKKDDLLKFETEQGDDHKVIIEIRTSGK